MAQNLRAGRRPQRGNRNSEILNGETIRNKFREINKVVATIDGVEYELVSKSSCEGCELGRHEEGCCASEGCCCPSFNGEAICAVLGVVFKKPSAPGVLKKYTVEVTERYSKEYEVEAETPELAVCYAKCRGDQDNTMTDPENRDAIEGKIIGG